MEDNCIKLMNPKVVKLEIRLVTTRTTKRGTIKKLAQPKLWLNAAIEVTDQLSPCCVYQDEHDQTWYATPNPTDVITIVNVCTDAYSFKMPTQLYAIFSTASMNSSAQPQPNKSVRYFYKDGFHPIVRTIGGDWTNDRTRFFSNKVLIEVTKESYERILVDEAKIAETKKQMGLTDTSHHKVVELNEEQLNQYLSSGYKLREL